MGTKINNGKQYWIEQKIEYYAQHQQHNRLLLQHANNITVF